jgi:hypothetical protein
MVIYQLISFVNAFNKRSKKWESLRNITKVFVGKEGLKSAYFEFENEVREQKYYNEISLTNYSEIKGKVEVHKPHVHKNGTLAYWGDKVLHSYNPKNI